MNIVRRKIEETIGFLFYIMSLLLVSTTSWAAYANVMKSGWGQDAAAWMQAAGSIAAITGAAWLSQSEVRQARRTRREQNEETAWFVRFAIRQAQQESHIIAAELVNRKTPVEMADIRDWRQRANTATISLNSLADRTDYIHPAVAHVISNCKVLMDELINDLNELAKIVKNKDEPDKSLIGHIVTPHRAILELIDLYDSTMRGIRIAMDEGGDALPIKNWETWDPDKI